MLLLCLGVLSVIFSLIFLARSVYLYASRRARAAPSGGSIKLETQKQRVKRRKQDSRTKYLAKRTQLNGVGLKPSPTLRSLRSAFAQPGGKPSECNESSEPSQTLKEEHSLSKLQDKLLARNMAHAVVTEICEGIASPRDEKLREKISQNLNAYGLRKLVQDIKDRDKVQSSGRLHFPYLILVLGVNGVGKTTNLAKLAHYLKSCSLKVGLVAADTFRAGAIEQLTIHARKLDIPVFAKGYGSDAASVGYEAKSKAAKWRGPVTFHIGGQEEQDKKKEKEKEKGKEITWKVKDKEASIELEPNPLDVLLVDTAGRMSNNKPLFAELSKLVRVLSPDLSVFVGEAHAGNDLLQQVTDFQKAIREGSPKHQVDALILSKFDVANSSGAGMVASLAYLCEKPVLFLGTGQEYGHLAEVEKEKILQSLLE